MEIISKYVQLLLNVAVGSDISWHFKYWSQHFTRLVLTASVTSWNRFNITRTCHFFLLSVVCGPQETQAPYRYVLHYGFHATQPQPRPCWIMYFHQHRSDQKLGQISGSDPFSTYMKQKMKTLAPQSYTSPVRWNDSVH